jgi:phosphate-selective porin OprO/OprP
MNLFLRIAAGLALVVAFAAPRAAAAETANPSLQKEVESYLQDTKAATGGDSTAKVEWKPGKGLTFATGDKAFTMHIGGRVFFDSYWATSDDFDSGSTEDASFFRTIRLEADGTMFTNAFYKIQVDFVGAEVALKDVFIGLKKLGPAGTFTAGHFKVPFGLEELTSSRFITFMERAAASQAFAPSRENGFMLNNNFAKDGMLGVFAAIYRYNTNDQGNITDDGSTSFAVRFAAFFLHDKEENRVLHVGFGYTYVTAVDDTLRFRARPGVGNIARFVDTADFAANDASLFCAELLFHWKAFHAQLEFFGVEAQGAGGPEPSFTGWYVEVGYFLVGGRRHYSTDKKVVERAEIDQNFHAGGGGPGAWQIAFRYDTIDLTDGGIAGGVQDTITFGVNWYWNPHMRVMFNYIWADISDGGPLGEGELNIFAMRFQVDF